MPRMFHHKVKAWILDSPCSYMLSEAHRVLPLETGGVLLGYWSEDHMAAVVTNAVGPGPQAQHDYCSFIPDYDYHCAEIARIYEASGRRYTYLGDWHTHPGGSPRLSRRDRLTLRRIARHEPARVRTPLMLVVFGNDEWRMQSWCYFSRGRFRRSRFVPIPTVPCL
jgi:integrative and conjugative element protein (TIGR02256 family)